jgi:hypothetical protein
MKHFLHSIFFILAVIGCIPSVQAQNLDNPGDYMSAIASAHVEMNKKYMAYMSASAHGGGARKIDNLRQQVLESITASRYKTIDLPIYKGDNSLRQSSIDYIQLCYNVFNEDYSKIVNMEEISEQSFDEMQAYLLLQEKTNEKIKEASAKMSEASKNFAAKYKVTLIDSKDELSQKMDAAGKLNHYRNNVFLVFFKCNWQESEITKAINAKKINDVEQGRNSLIRFAEEGLKALDTLRTFNGDASLANTCRQVLQFYKKTAENDVPKISEFFLKEENFEKIKKSLDSKPESNRTEQDINEYNKAVKDMNTAVNNYNQVNTQLNNNKSQVLQNWQNTQTNFGNTHMPYYKS